MGIVFDDDDISEVPPAQGLTPLTKPDTTTFIHTVDNITLSNALKSLNYPRITVDYFAQFGGSDDEVHPLSYDREATYQTYQSVEDLELWTLSPAELMYTSVQVLFPPQVVPSLFDVVVLRLPDGRNGIFQVDGEVIRKTYMADSLYEVTLSMVVIGESLKWKDLKNKTVKRSQYIKSRLSDGLNPVISTDAYTRSQELSEALTELMYDYYQEFYDRKFKTFVIRDQEGRILYDPKLVRHIRQILPKPINPIESLKIVGNYLDTEGIWESLMSMSELPLSTGYRKVQWANYASIPAVGVEPKLLGESKVYIAIPEGQYAGIMLDLDRLNFPEEDPLDPLKQSTYIVSSDYYDDNNEPRSTFEALIEQHMAKERLSRDGLDLMLAEYQSWSAQRKYFHVPVLMTLLRMELQR